MGSMGLVGLAGLVSLLGLVFLVVRGCHCQGLANLGIFLPFDLILRYFQMEYLCSIQNPKEFDDPRVSKDLKVI